MYMMTNTRHGMASPRDQQIERQISASKEFNAMSTPDTTQTNANEERARTPSPGKKSVADVGRAARMSERSNELILEFMDRRECNLFTC